MKVLCVIDTLGAAGAQRQIIGLSSLLKQNGYKVMLVWYHDKPYDKEELETANVEIYNKVVSNPFSKLLVVRKAIKFFKPDVVIAYIDGPTIITSLLKLLGGKFKLIVSERNTNISISIKERLKFFLYNWADYIVPNSFSQSFFLKENYPNLYKKTHVITNYTDINKFVQTLDKNYDNSIINILVVARIVQQKNVLGFIEAVKMLVDKGYKFNVKWYGKPFKREYYDECVSLIHTLNIADYFQFHNVDFNIVDIYNKADVFCLPSYREGYPNVVCEAMACGLPVLCSNVCDNATIVREGENGFLFNPYDVKDMSDVLSKFINLDNKTKKMMSDKSRELSETMFSKEIFLKKYINLINR